MRGPSSSWRRSSIATCVTSPAGSSAEERRTGRLQPTELVHEAYLRLLDWRAVRWQNRAHFFATTARNDAPSPGERCAGPAGGETRQRCRCRAVRRP